MASAGLMMALSPGAPGPMTTAIELASVDSLLAPLPLSPRNDDVWWLGGDGAESRNSFFGNLFRPPTPNALLSANSSPSSGSLFGGFDFGNSCGLVCNGADGTEANPNGQDGGLLFGNGGNGWNSTVAGVNGGNGGKGGLFFGNGGAGGNGADGVGALAGSNGGDGGDTGKYALFGNAGNGGRGGNGANGTVGTVGDPGDTPPVAGAVGQAGDFGGVGKAGQVGRLGICLVRARPALPVHLVRPARTDLPSESSVQTATPAALAA